MSKTVEANAGSPHNLLDNDRTAAKLEKEHVLQVYDQIASHFSVTRHKPWPKVLEVRSIEFCP